MFEAVTAVVLIVYVACCLGLVFFVLLQKGDGGLGSAFGGQALETALGAQSAQAWRKATAILAALFLFLTVSLVEIADHRFATSSADRPAPEQKSKPSEQKAP